MGAEVHVREALCVVGCRLQLLRATGVVGRREERGYDFVLSLPAACLLASAWQQPAPVLRSPETSSVFLRPITL